VIPHKALGLLLYLNSKKIVQGLAGEKKREKSVIRFGLIFFKLNNKLDFSLD
jgi:hypothetical protein